MTTIDITTLEASVDALIQQEVAKFEAQLRETLGRRLAGRVGASRKPKRRAGTAKRPTPAAPRRTAEELEALAMQFLAAVEATPGEGMSTLAPQLGLTAKELERPVQRLKTAGRIKTVGERSRMRYYPVPAPAA